MATRDAFLREYRAAVLAEYGPGSAYPWAADASRLDSFMGKVRVSLESGRPTFDHRAPCVARAWRAAGCSGRPTFKGLVALPA